MGGALASLVILALAPFADTLFGTDGLAAPMAAAAAIPFLASPENVSASALLLRGRYDLRGGLLSVTMGIRLVAIVVGASIGVTAALGALALGQLAATAIVGTAGASALRRFPRREPRPLGADRREIFSFVVQSSVATGVISLRSALTPVLLGVVAGTTQVRATTAWHSPRRAASPPRARRSGSCCSPSRRATGSTAGSRTSSAGSGATRSPPSAVAAVAVPVFLLAMPWLVRVVFGAEYLSAVDAARIVLVAAAIQLVLGWSKSLPVTVGRPHLRIVTHGIETLVLLPLVVVLGDRYGVTGAAVAILVSTMVFAAAWAVVLVRLRTRAPRCRPRRRAESGAP